MAYQTLTVEEKDGVAIITVNRPDKLNALNARVKTELREVLAQLRTAPAVHVLILTGSGDKSFVAGTDIAELTDLTADTGREFSLRGQEVFDMIENLGKPVIAAVNGYALGGGCELALACHIRIASDNAKFGQPEVNLGVIPGYGGTQRLARLVGKGRAMEMILTGNPISAQEALQVGLVNKVVSRPDLMPACLTLAQTIVAKGQVAVRLAVQAVNGSQEKSLSEGLRLEAKLFGDCCASDDFREGTRAFLEKRKAVFKNQ